MSLTRQQALAVRQILASSLISTDPTSASCEYHRLPAKNIQLIQSITLITDALPSLPTAEWCRSSWWRGSHHPPGMPDHAHSLCCARPELLHLSLSTPAAPDLSFSTPAVPDHSSSSMQPSQAANLPLKRIGEGPLLYSCHRVILPLLSCTEQDQVSTKLLSLTEMQKVAIHPAYLVPDYHTVILSLPRVSSAQPPSPQSLFSPAESSP